jgi:hypothetical protein
MRQIFFATKLLTNNSEILGQTNNLKSADKNVSRARMRAQIVAIKNLFRASRP